MTAWPARRHSHFSPQQRQIPQPRASSNATVPKSPRFTKERKFCRAHQQKYWTDEWMDGQMKRTVPNTPGAILAEHTGLEWNTYVWMGGGGALVSYSKKDLKGTNLHFKALGDWASWETLTWPIIVAADTSQKIPAEDLQNFSQELNTVLFCQWQYIPTQQPLTWVETFAPVLLPNAVQCQHSAGRPQWPASHPLLFASCWLLCPTPISSTWADAMAASGSHRTHRDEVWSCWTAQVQAGRGISLFCLCQGPQAMLGAN